MRGELHNLHSTLSAYDDTPLPPSHNAGFAPEWKPSLETYCSSRTRHFPCRYSALRPQNSSIRSGNGFPTHPDPLILRAPPCLERRASRSRLEIHARIETDTRPSNGIRYSTWYRLGFNSTHPARPTAFKICSTHAHGPGLHTPSCQLDGFAPDSQISPLRFMITNPQILLLKSFPRVLHRSLLLKA